MSEALIQTKLVTLFQANDDFADSSIVINDWSIRDWSTVNSPYVLIADSMTFEVDLSSQCPIVSIAVPVMLIVAWRDWQETYNLFRDYRGSLIGTLLDNLTFGDSSEYVITDIRNGGTITEFYDPYTPEEQLHEALPLFVTQQINVTISQMILD